MISKTFVFSRIQKTTKNIEDSINEFLKDHEFKFATQNESVVKGKFIVTVFGDEKKSSIRIKAFKDQNIQNLDMKVNEFISKIKTKFVTQTFVGSNVYTIIFYDSNKNKEEEVNV